jgi:hypothetical protein
MVAYIVQGVLCMLMLMLLQYTTVHVMCLHLNVYTTPPAAAAGAAAAAVAAAPRVLHSWL